MSSQPPWYRKAGGKLVLGNHSTHLYVHPSSYPTSMFKDLYTEILAIKFCVAELFGNLRGTLVQGSEFEIVLSINIKTTVR